MDIYENTHTHNVIAVIEMMFLKCFIFPGRKIPGESFPCFTSLTLSSFQFNLLLPDKYQQFSIHAFSFTVPLGDQQSSCIMDQSQGETNNVHLILFPC